MEIQINTIDENGRDLRFEARAQTLPELAALEKTGEYKFLIPSI